MKQFFFGVLIMSCCIPARAQQDYFIFIQDPSRQPFYVRLGEESHSSSAGGHLILSSLKDSVYNLFVGFPGNREPEQLFTIDIAGRDKGFALQQHGGAWQLFDLQALTLIKPATVGGREGRPVKKDDSYSRLMAGVVDDTTVLYIYVPESTPASAEALVSGATKTSAASRPAAPQARSVPSPSNASKTPAAASQPQSVSPQPNVSQRVPAKDASVAVREPEKHTPRTVGTDPDGTEQKGAVHPQAGAETAAAAFRAGAAPDRQPVQAITDQPRPAPVLDSRDIIRYRTENLREGRLFIYVDRSTAVSDTISLIIPRL